VRRVEYHAFLEEKKKKIIENIHILVELKKREISRRVRDPRKLEALIQVDLQRYQKWVERGVLEKISPRHFRIHFDKL
jgi:hypothetical protein